MSYLSWILFNPLRVLHAYGLQTCVKSLLSIHVLMCSVFTLLVNALLFLDVNSSYRNDFTGTNILTYNVTFILLHNIVPLVKYGVPGLPR